MVCVPCFLIPVILWIFHKFIQPWLSKIWSNSENYVTSNLTCPMPQKKKKIPEATDTGNSDITEEDNGHSSASTDHLKAE